MYKNFCLRTISLFPKPYLILNQTRSVPVHDRLQLEQYLWLIWNFGRVLLKIILVARMPPYFGLLLVYGLFLLNKFHPLFLCNNLVVSFSGLHPVILLILLSLLLFLLLVLDLQQLNTTKLVIQRCCTYAIFLCLCFVSCMNWFLYSAYY